MRQIVLSIMSGCSATPTRYSAKTSRPNLRVRLHTITAERYPSEKFLSSSLFLLKECFGRPLTLRCCHVLTHRLVDSVDSDQ